VREGKEIRTATNMTRSGTSTTSTTTSKAIVNAYCFLAALFFAACAWAQCNDPDPVLWILDYIIGGCLFSFLVVFLGTPSAALMNGSNSANKNAKVDPHTDEVKIRIVLRNLMTIFVVGNASVVLYMLSTLIPKIDFASSSPKELGWSVMEFEEGREIAGLAILLSHVLKLRGHIITNTQASQEKKDARNDTAHGYCNLFTTHAGTTAMVATIVGAMHLWVYYQPLMNAKYNTAHCDGAFGDSRVVDDGGNHISNREL